MASAEWIRRSAVTIFTAMVKWIASPIATA
jgi:hypothetical protein